MNTQLDKEIINLRRQVQGMVESWAKFNNVSVIMSMDIVTGFEDPKVYVTVGKGAVPQSTKSGIYMGLLIPEETKADNL